MTDYATHIKEAFEKVRAEQVAFQRRRRERGPCPYGFDREDNYAWENVLNEVIYPKTPDIQLAAARELVRRLEEQAREEVKS